MRSIAIIGAGFSGLAIAYYLLKKNNNVTLFDALPIGEGTSGIAAGLLHPFAGAHAKLNPHGFEGYHHTYQLLEVASQALGERVYSHSKLLRLATTEEQVLNYKKAAENYKEVVWKTEEECLTLVPGISAFPGIYLPDALTVYSKPYLQGLFKACCLMGLEFEQRKISNLTELKAFEQVVIAAGAYCKQFANLPITQVKGQILELSYPLKEPIAMPLNSYGYLLMKGSTSCIAGSSYERDFTDDLVDVERAKKEILPKVISLLPDLENALILDCKAGMRASTPTHLPIAKQIDSRHFILTGMGSKGLLYHSLYAEKLSEIMQS